MANFNKDDFEERVPLQVKEGNYDFYVVKAEEKLSRAGNEMIALEILFEVDAEQPITVYDYLVFTPKALCRVKNFCESICLQEKWETGSLETEDCLGAEGTAHLILGQAKENGNRYMEVKYYCEPDGFSEHPINTLTTAQQKKLDEARATIKKPEPVAENQGACSDGDDIPF